MAEKSLGLFFWFSLLFFFFLSFIYTVRLNVLTWTTTIKVLHYYKYMIHAYTMGVQEEVQEEVLLSNSVVFLAERVDHHMQVTPHRTSTCSVRLA